MALLLDRFIIDGFSYDFLPLNISQINTPEYSVRTSRYLTLNLDAQVITAVKSPENAEDFSYLRKVHKQAWVVEFDIIDQCLHDHLKILYDTQKHFYIQFDDEMSRDNAPLIRAGETGRAFFTPTFPIKPYGYYPGSSVDYLNDLKLYNGTTTITLNSGYIINEALGMVVLNNPISENVIAVLSYTWRANVRIVGFDLRPRPDLAQGYYTGQMVIEQVSTYDSNDPYTTLAPCFLSANPNGTNATVVSDIPSDFQDLSLSGSSGYVSPTPSGATIGTLVATDLYSTVLPD